MFINVLPKRKLPFIVCKSNYNEYLSLSANFCWFFYFLFKVQKKLPQGTATRTKKRTKDLIHIAKKKKNREHLKMIAGWNDVKINPWGYCLNVCQNFSFKLKMDCERWIVRDKELLRESERERDEGILWMVEQIYPIFVIICVGFLFCSKEALTWEHIHVLF